MDSLEDDSDISEKIIVVDDPICSLDRGRRNHTKRILCDISKKSKQIIIMGHDPYFLRDIHDDLVDKKKYNIETLIIRLNRINNKYSDFSRIEDINHECKSEYYNHYKTLEDFVKNGSSNYELVAKSIRPLLEGYLHRRFPAHIPRSTLFGAIVGKVNMAEATNPLFHLKSITKELNEINDYAGDFHHDTDSSDTISIDDAELLTYVKRTLLVIQKG